MTKQELIQQAETLNIEISDPDHTTKAQIEQMISNAQATTDAEAVVPNVQSSLHTIVQPVSAKTYTRTKSRDIKSTVMAWFDELGTTDAVTKADFNEFMQRVLAICPHWAKKDNPDTAKKHFSWYKSFWKKQEKLRQSTAAAAENESENPSETEAELVTA